jgi:hypothetical protein
MYYTPKCLDGKLFSEVLIPGNLSALENKSLTQLYAARPVGLRGDQAESGIGRRQVRECERRSVHHVKALKPQLKILLLRDVEAFQYGRVQLVGSISPQAGKRRGEVSDMVGELVGRLGVKRRCIERYW